MLKTYSEAVVRKLQSKLSSICERGLGTRLPNLFEGTMRLTILNRRSA